jgi:branched-subunit amino acid permease
LQALAIVHQLPLDDLGFGWLVPTFVAALVGSAIARIRQADR